MLAYFSLLFLQHIANMLSLKTIRGLSKEYWKIGNFLKVIMPKIIGIRLRFGFQLPKKLGLEPPEWHFGSSEDIFWEAIGIWPRLHFLLKKLIQRLWSTITYPKSYNWGAILRIYLTFTYSIFWPILIPNPK